MSISLAFYKVNSSYCDYLRQFDCRVPYTFDDKTNRPFVGVVIENEGLKYKYYIPLTSPKAKHSLMKNNIDFQKINDGKLGALNFNNMIPVTDDAIIKIDPSELPVGSKEEQSYKSLIEKQLSWCNANKELIIRKAIKLHDMVVKEKAPENIARRTCSFSILEKACQEWIVNRGTLSSGVEDKDTSYKCMNDRRKDIKEYKDRQGHSSSGRIDNKNHER